MLVSKNTQKANHNINLDTKIHTIQVFLNCLISAPFLPRSKRVYFVWIKQPSRLSSDPDDLGKLGCNCKVSDEKVTEQNYLLEITTIHYNFFFTL